MLLNQKGNNNETETGKTIGIQNKENRNTKRCQYKYLKVKEKNNNNANTNTQRTVKEFSHIERHLNETNAFFFVCKRKNKKEKNKG